MSSTSYSYFDQFSDVQVDLSPYLNNIKDTYGIDYSFTNIQSPKPILKNLFERVDIVANFKKNILFFDSYTVQDGERPEDVSFRKYDVVDNWWIICLFNGVKNIWMDWVMTEDQLQAMADKLFETENKYTRNTYYDLLFERNESMRHILVLKPIYINDLVTAYRTAVEG